MKKITLDCKARGFNGVTTFWDGVFEHLTDWMRNELHVTLITCAADSHVLRAENEI